jgi:hypothetical protein
MARSWLLGGGGLAAICAVLGWGRFVFLHFDGCAAAGEIPHFPIVLAVILAGREIQNGRLGMPALAFGFGVYEALLDRRISFKYRTFLPSRQPLLKEGTCTV